MRTVGLVFEHAADFDLIHAHVDYFHLPFTRLVRTPVVATLHGRLDIPDLPAIFGAYPEAPLISISNSQRRPLPWANWVATVYHGLPVDTFTLGAGDGGYLAFLGRIAPEKGIDVAIAVARAVGLPLRIAAKVDQADREYYETTIKPLLDGSDVEFVGEVDDVQKNEFLGHARALLFPIRWPEPFGIVLIEALACGTPVLAFDWGAVAEVLVEGKTGFVCRTADELVAAVGRIGEIDRAACRRYAERHYSVAAMVDRYEAAYERILLADRPIRARRTFRPIVLGDGGLELPIDLDTLPGQPLGQDYSPGDLAGDVVPE